MCTYTCNACVVNLVPEVHSSALETTFRLRRDVETAIGMSFKEALCQNDIFLPSLVLVVHCIQEFLYFYDNEIYLRTV